MSEPRNPIEISQWDEAETCLDIQIVDDYAFISKWYNGLAIWDISNPTQPNRLLEYSGLKETKMVSIEGNRIYAADGYNGFVILEMEIELETTTADKSSSTSTTQASTTVHPSLILSGLVLVSIYSIITRKID